MSLPPSVTIEALAASFNLPELIQQGQEILALEAAKRAQFLEDITPEDKWEFIQGEVICHSPALRCHLNATGNLYKLMSIFVQQANCGSVYVEKALVSFPRNDYEPDVVFFGPEKTRLFEAKTLKFPPPELVVEVLSESTEDRDRGIKFIDYAFHGVGEYWIVDPVDETVEIYRLESGGNTFLPAEVVSEGFLESSVIPGFRIPLAAIFDETTNTEVLQKMNPDKLTLEKLDLTMRKLVETDQMRATAERQAEEAAQKLAEMAQKYDAIAGERDAIAGERDAIAGERDQLHRLQEATQAHARQLEMEIQKMRAQIQSSTP